MSAGFQWYSADAVGQDIVVMTVHYAVDGRKAFVYLAVYVSLDVPAFGVFLNWCGIFDLVLNEVVGRTD